MTDEPLSAAPLRTERRLSAVLPLRVGDYGDGRDFERAELLFDSLERFGAADVIEAMLVVTPPGEVEAARRRLSRWPSLGPEVISETDILPEISRYPSVSGWTKQQLIKLAAARVVATSFYLTFDADVVCTHALSRENLLPGGKGLLQPEAKSVHGDWWAASARLLNLAPRMNEAGMCVTPAILAAEISSGLIEALGARAGRRSWADHLMRPHRRHAVEQFIPGYRRRHRWTEYALYYLYAQDRGLLEEWHVSGGSAATPQLLISEASVWSDTALADWDPKAIFSAADPALFCVIQSNRMGDPAELRQRLAPYLS